MVYSKENNRFGIDNDEILLAFQKSSVLLLFYLGIINDYDRFKLNVFYCIVFSCYFPFKNDRVIDILRRKLILISSLYKYYDYVIIVCILLVIPIDLFATVYEYYDYKLNYWLFTFRPLPRHKFF